MPEISPSNNPAAVNDKDIIALFRPGNAQPISQSVDDVVKAVANALILAATEAREVVENAIKGDIGDLERVTSALSVVSHNDWANVSSTTAGAFKLDSIQEGIPLSDWEVSHVANRRSTGSPAFELQLRIPLADNAAQYRFITTSGQIFDHNNLQWSEGASDNRFRYFEVVGTIQLPIGEILRLQRSTRISEILFDGDITGRALATVLGQLTPPQRKALVDTFKDDDVNRLLREHSNIYQLITENTNRLVEIEPINTIAWVAATNTQAQWLDISDANYSSRTSAAQLAALGGWKVTGTISERNLVFRINKNLDNSDFRFISITGTGNTHFLLDSSIFEDIGESGDYVYFRTVDSQTALLAIAATYEIQYHGILTHTRFKGDVLELPTRPNQAASKKYVDENKPGGRLTRTPTSLFVSPATWDRSKTTHRFIVSSTTPVPLNSDTITIAFGTERTILSAQTITANQYVAYTINLDAAATTKINNANAAGTALVVSLNTTSAAFFAQVSILVE